MKRGLFVVFEGINGYKRSCYSALPPADRWVIKYAINCIPITISSHWFTSSSLDRLFAMAKFSFRVASASATGDCTMF